MSGAGPAVARRRRVLTVLLALGALASALAGSLLLGALGGGGGGSGAMLLAGAAAALALGAPPAAARLARGAAGDAASERLRRRARAKIVLAAGGLAAALAGYAVAGPAGVVVLVLLGIHGGALTAKDSVGACLLALLSPALVANLGLLATRSVWTLVAYALGLLVAVAGGVLLDSERTAQLARRRLQRRSESAAAALRPAGSGAGFAFALAGLALVAAPFAAAGVRTALAPLLGEQGGGTVALDESPTNAAGSANARAAAAQATAPQSFPEGVDFGQQSAGTGERVLIEVSEGGAPPASPVYLLGLRLERFTAEGIEPRGGVEGQRRWPAAGSAPRAADAGPWRVELGDATAGRAPREGAPRIDVRQVPVPSADGSGSLVFRGGDATWIEFAAAPPGGLERRASGALVLADGGAIPELLRFAFERSAAPRPVADADAALALQLPYTRAELGALEPLALRLEREAGGPGATAEQRVQAVARHFASGYGYRFEGAGLLGLANLERFVEEREGFCTQFASTACLLLRRLGVPARVAIGYLAGERDEETGARLARERNAHAWVEVASGDAGWRVLDVTPGGAIAAARENAGKRLDELVAENRLEAAAAAWREDPIGQLPALLAAWLRLQLLRFDVGRRELLAVGLGLLLVLLGMRLFGRGRARRSTHRIAGGPHPVQRAAALRARLIEGLARGSRSASAAPSAERAAAAGGAQVAGGAPATGGVQPQRGARPIGGAQTAREWLQRWVLEGRDLPPGLVFEDLRDAVLLADRGRFAPAGLEAAELARIEAACAALGA